MPAGTKHHDELKSEPFWYKSGVIYQVHVRAFFDANGDGAGDFRGLSQKLDYIKELGVTAIWLLPFYPSPLKDDGYDIADYRNVHPMYGTLGDFKIFLREAHKRGLRIITELVLNHTSDQHPWFQRARHAPPGSRWRNFYVWSDTAQKYQGTRIIFKDVELSNWTWDHAAKAYFWHRFFSHQPDLNFENPEVHAQIFKVVDFWLDLGVDGLRLDAVPYLYEREGTSCENLPETHAFLKELRAHVDEKYRDRMLLGEANQWPEDAVKYFGQGRGDECHMAFHFPLMPRLFMALRMEDRLPIVDILEQTPPIPETSQWALFLRNHDELTLEMVTDEERDYMYRMYAQVHQARLNLGIRRRLAPLLSNDRKSIELLNALLFSLPGTPVLYYGDEIGIGENIYLGDRNGVRTPMQWSSDKNAGFSRANPQSLYLPIILDPAYHYEACNVEAQLANPHSLLWWMRRMLTLRKNWRALGEGKCEFLQPDNHKILSYVLRYQNEIILVVANLSRFVQPTELDLSAFKGMIPAELFGRGKFPAITEAPYFFTLGPHNFFWFSLEPQPKPQTAKSDSAAPALLPSLAVNESWQEIFDGEAKTRFDAILPQFLRTQKWLASRVGAIKFAMLREFFCVPLPNNTQATLALIQTEFMDASPELHVLPLAFASGNEAASHRADGVAEISFSDPVRNGVLYDAFGNPDFAQALLTALRWRERLRNNVATVESIGTPALRRILATATSLTPVVKHTHDGNTNVIFGESILLKFFRRVEANENPELEVGRFLTSIHFPYAPPVLGAFECHGIASEPITLGVVREFIPHAQSGWDFTLDAIGHYYDQVIAIAAQGQQPEGDKSANLIGTYAEFARLLGKRSAELHLALESGPANSEFTAEPVMRHSLRGLYQSMRFTAVQNLRLLRKELRALPADLVPVAERILQLEPTILQRYQRFTDQEFPHLRLRIHGDFHLGQVLWTGRDVAFLDFEGDNTKSVSQRRIKHCPLRDVARMLRSFHHAAYVGLQQQAEMGAIQKESLLKFEPWVRHWNQTTSRAFVQAYSETMRTSNILPNDPTQLRIMLVAYVLDRVMNELGEGLRQRSDNLRAPLQAVVYLTEEQLTAPLPPPPEIKTTS